MAAPETLGLRDRKRMETRARLEEAAITLVLRDGLEHTTVDAISELADVSPRTFFNYFDSKDACILGFREIQINRETAAAQIAQLDGLDLLESVVRLLVITMDSPIPQTEAKEQRIEILRRFPELVGDLIVRISRFTSELVGAVGDLLERDPQFVPQSPTERLANAELLLSLCGGALRVAIREWVEADTSDSAEELEQRALSLIRGVVAKVR